MNTGSHLFTLSNLINSLSKTKRRSSLGDLSLQEQHPDGSMDEIAPGFVPPTLESPKSFSAGSPIHEFLNRL